MARIGAAHFGAGLLNCEHPFDTEAGGISQSFPGGDLGFEALPGSDPAVEALAAEHADFDLNHEPAARTTCRPVISQRACRLLVACGKPDRYTIQPAIDLVEGTSALGSA